MYGVVICSLWNVRPGEKQLELRPRSAGKEFRMSGNSLPFNQNSRHWAEKGICVKSVFINIKILLYLSQM